MATEALAHALHHSHPPSIHAEQPADPDAQATISDFLTYTEYLPSDLYRSLTLIRSLDERYSGLRQRIHDLTTIYGALPSLTKATAGGKDDILGSSHLASLVPLDAAKKPDPVQLRKQISDSLSRAIVAREASYAEACRLAGVAERREKELVVLGRKLKALPPPPSRDPTPVPVSPRISRRDVQPRSPELVRETRPRITLHLGGQRGILSGAEQKARNRRITVPGEVLPPPNPDSPDPTTMSDYESTPPNSPVHAAPRVSPTQHRNRPLKLLKLPKSPKIPKEKKMSATSRVRQPSGLGTNAHSAVAGISTSNALRLLSPPPVEAPNGSRWKPWFKLSEYEMAKLRKKMKKNAVWMPSATMVRRELATRGRGSQGYDDALKRAAETGEVVLDEDPADFGMGGSREGEPGGAAAFNAADNQASSGISATPGVLNKHESLDDGESTVNRGMRLNEAKKLKRETMLREQAVANAAELEEANKKIAGLGKGMKDLFGPVVPENKKAIAATTANVTSKKRKRDDGVEASINVPASASTAAGNSNARPGPQLKKLKIALPTPPTLAPAPATSAGPTEGTTKTLIPLAPAAPSPVKKSDPSTSSALEPKAPTAAAIRSTRTSVAPSSAKDTPTASTPSPSTAKPAKPVTRPPSSRASAVPPPSTSTRQRGKAASAEPQPLVLGLRRHSLRRGSNTSLPSQAPPEPTSTFAPTGRGGRRGGRRPAPGMVTADADGGAKVSVGKRKAAPRKKGALGVKKPEEVPAPAAAAAELWEDVDPDEPRYCICGDVSWGTMIACENDECEKEWFHLPCIGLTEIPGRRVKWYCPDCRKKLGISKFGEAKEGRKK